MNFLQLSPLTTQPAQLSSSTSGRGIDWAKLSGEVKIWNYLLDRQCQSVSVSLRTVVSINHQDILNPMAKSHDFPFIGFHSNSNFDILPIKELQLPGDPKIRTPDVQFLRLKFLPE